MSPLITATDLASTLGEVTLLDVRWRLGGPSGPSEFAAGHIPGAVYCDLDTALAAPAGAGGRHPLPSAEAFEASMRALGVSDERPVVVYDDWNSLAAARAWWCLRYFGHRDVRVLDGGLRAWTGELSKDASSVAPGDFTARPGGMPLIDADQAAILAEDGLLLDARAPERYRGEVEPVDPVAGHIPGAVNAPTTENLEPGGRFHQPEFLRERFNTLGAVEGIPVGAYCGSGVTAAHEVLALETAGIRASLYAGSWSEWITNPARPVEKS
ncbi:sulfurtransferase [Herbidospora cretacea]|uniref:sulfurtransferase n=1 Tax=Herbidospora cretacea TaxID=28444 RepID=UPI00077470EF|nr:sulfurtransferase [Herbidospora cretacea]